MAFNAHRREVAKLKEEKWETEYDGINWNELEWNGIKWKMGEVGRRWMSFKPQLFSNYSPVVLQLFPNDTPFDPHWNIQFVFDGEGLKEDKKDKKGMRRG